MHGIYHPANLRRIDNFDNVIDAPQPQAADCFAVALLAANHAFNQFNSDFVGSHAGSLYAAVISSTDFPRLAAISDGVFILFNPSSVARTTL